ncbi:MAG: TniB family NTP-binding protein [Arcobacteraceae bacterium]|jgi:Cdc6-like AAA superfamily ATPase|nr:TniB family NTP-binding protein [Arcobacteraceae bacterium]
MSENISNQNLSPQFYKYLQMSDKERINFIRKDKWIEYPAARKVLQKIEDIFDAPPSIRPKGMLIYGVSNNGKTAILKKFYRAHQAGEYTDEDGDVVNMMPVVYAVAQSSAEESRMYSEILSSMGIVIKHNEKVAKKLDDLIYYLKLMKTRLIIIDEIHNVLHGAHTKMTQLMAALKTLSNKTGVPIILAGTENALAAINIDNQTKSRFKPYELKQWSHNEDYMRFIATFEAMLPLKNASNLFQNKGLLSEVYIISDGAIGETLDILEAAAIEAIRRKSERITRKEIKNSL